MLFITHLLGMPLHPGQVKYLRQTTELNSRINVLVPANRWGKTSLAACIQIWYLFYKHGIPPGNRETWFKAEYRTANIAPHSAMTEPLFKYIHQIMSSRFSINTPDGRIVNNKCQLEWFYLANRTINTPPYKQFFHNNSYIEHRSLGSDQGDALQGKPYGIITYDEGGRSIHLKEEVMGNIIPRLADWVGPFHLLSTPDQGSPSILYHHELFKNGMAGLKGYYSQEGSLRDNILLGKEAIEAQYAMYADDPMGPQVLDGKFIFGGDNYFNFESIVDAQDESLDAGKRYQEGRRYVIATDSAISSDEMVHTVLDVTDLKVEKNPEGPPVISGEAQLVRQSAVKGNAKSPQQHLNDFIDLYESYRGPDSMPEYILETWNGESARWYMDLPQYIQVRTRCYGSWQPEKRVTENRNKPATRTTAIKKSDILMSLSKLLNARALKIFKNDPNRHEDGADLAQQLSIYREDDAKLPTDRLISLALAAWLASETSTFQKALKWITL